MTTLAPLFILVSVLISIGGEIAYPQIKSSILPHLREAVVNMPGFGTHVGNCPGEYQPTFRWRGGLCVYSQESTASVSFREPRIWRWSFRDTGLGVVGSHLIVYVVSM